MNAVVRLKLEMAARVRDFLRNHPLDGPGLTAGVTGFDALLARATGHRSLQQEGVANSRGATQHRKELKDLVRNSLLRHVVTVAQVVARERPELAAVFQLPSLNAHLSFVTAAGRILAEAEANKDLLISTGMGDSALEDLRKALAELEAADVDGSNARANHVGAKADLAAVATEIMDQVKLLDGTVRYKFRNDPEILAAWKSARNVPLRVRKTPSVPVAPVVPVALIPSVTSTLNQASA